MDLSLCCRADATEPELPSRRYPPVLTRYELARTLGMRAEQLLRGSEPLVPVADVDTAFSIAERELRRGYLDAVIRRYYPDGSHEDWRVSELRLPSLLRDA